MFNQLKPCSRRFEQQFMSEYPQLENPWRYQSGSHGSFIEEPERSLEESEVVDELLQILVECMKKSDVRTQEVLLRKFFFEIEKEVPMERFLVERIRHTKISMLSGCLENIPAAEMVAPPEFCMREVGISSEETPEKLERFKVKNIQIGELVKEEPK